MTCSSTASSTPAIAPGHPQPTPQQAERERQHDRAGQPAGDLAPPRTVAHPRHVDRADPRPVEEVAGRGVAEVEDRHDRDGRRDAVGPVLRRRPRHRPTDEDRRDGHRRPDDPAADHARAGVGHRVAEDPVGLDPVDLVAVRGDVRRRVDAPGHERVVEQGRRQVGAGLRDQPGEECRHRGQVGAEPGVGRDEQLTEVPVEVGQPTLEREGLDALLGVALEDDPQLLGRGRAARPGRRRSAACRRRRTCCSCGTAPAASSPELHGPSVAPTDRHPASADA